jgi:hypothetical protein
VLSKPGLLVKFSCYVAAVSLVFSANVFAQHFLQTTQDDPPKNKKKTNIRLQVRTQPKNQYNGEARDKEIAAAFAPVFYQALGDTPRFDYLTNFDFDGDWQGDNNWNNAANAKFPLKGFVYYAVSETSTHYFIHYAVFHPRDYKGGQRKGAVLSEIIREGVKIGGQYDPTGMSDEAVLAHENDMEGCLVVAQKQGDDLKNAQLVFVESLAHNKFFKYVPETSTVEGFGKISVKNNSPRLFIEPKGHGIEAYTGTEKELQEGKKALRYVFKGQADNPEDLKDEAVGYDLIPLYTTLWTQAQGGANRTYGEAHDYNGLKFTNSLIEVPEATKQTKENKIGSAFLGKVGAKNMARPPWGWFDSSERDRPLGEWFFNPADTIKRHFKQNDEFSVSYLHQPFLSIFRQ